MVAGIDPRHVRLLPTRPEDQWALRPEDLRVGANASRVAGSRSGSISAAVHSSVWVLTSYGPCRAVLPDCQEVAREHGSGIASLASAACLYTCMPCMPPRLPCLPTWPPGSSPASWWLPLAPPAAAPWTPWVTSHRWPAGGEGAAATTHPNAQRHYCTLSTHSIIPPSLYAAAHTAHMPTHAAHPKSSSVPHKCRTIYAFPPCSCGGAWVHVDAAYAGAAALLPEQRHHFLPGLQQVDSYSFNPHKWLLVSFDCCALWVRDAGPLKEALSLTPVFLQVGGKGGREHSASKK